MVEDGKVDTVLILKAFCEILKPSHLSDRNVSVGFSKI